MLRRMTSEQRSRLFIGQGHISMVTDIDGNSMAEEGICRCDPQPDSDVLGECPKCHKLDIRKVSKKVIP